MKFLIVRGSLSELAIALVMTLVMTTPMAAQSQPATAFQIDRVATGLEHPWSIAFLPDGRMLLTERAGRLRVIDTDGQLLEQEIEDVPQAHVASQGGLMGIALHPNHEDNGWIYLSLAYGNARANTTRVVRGRLDGMRWVDNEVIFTAEPTRDTPVHYGGRIAFMGDDTLLITLGDGFDYREDAQRLDSHTGTIVRVHDDGRVPADNPFIGREEARPEIFSYGHRNPQGIVVDPDTGRIWSHEHGPRGGDELNLVRPGENYGWPVATHGIDYSGARITPYTSRPGMIDPLIDWTPSIAPSGMSRYHGDLFPEWEGDLLVTGLVSRAIHRVRIDGESAEEVEILLEDLDRRLRDVQVGPDGALYILTDEKEGEVLRLRP